MYLKRNVSSDIDNGDVGKTVEQAKDYERSDEDIDGLVIAGIGDLARPAEKLSLPQAGALSATGLIWSRYSLVIIPKNWNLFSVNVFVAATSLYQLARAVNYQMEQNKKAAEGAKPAASK